ncbi:hypothetical protein IGI04_007948 [Brassica rapa subsp. trilocularis]|uniref:RRM domain-containing protein n=1 Tax=Brassica rapa subsp. trilocularis TaxID=1813537 RepID=A0ABQ7NPI2_BRACM|nr:hypothetical protein IGI04_007948 [Brassica rapa subsp. trilocularis]
MSIQVHKSKLTGSVSLACGNVNFARRVEYNKCGAPAPSGTGDRGAGRGASDRGGGGRDSGRSYESSRYDGGSRSGGGGSSMGVEVVVLMFRVLHLLWRLFHPTMVLAVTLLHPWGMEWKQFPRLLAMLVVGPPSYGGPTGGYGGDAPSTGGRGGGYDGGSAPRRQEPSYEDAPLKKIYINNLPPDVTTDELKDLFGGIGQVGRIKQKRGYKDQWPYNIKIYIDEKGKNKGDACLTYEDPSAAHSTGGFFNSMYHG